MQDGMYLTLCSSVLLQTLTPMPKFKGIILFSVWVPKCLKAFMRVFGIWKLSVCISMSASLLKISWHFLCLYCDCQCCSNNCLNVQVNKFKRALKIRRVERWAAFCQAGQDVLWCFPWFEPARVVAAELELGAAGCHSLRCTCRQGCKENEEMGAEKGARFLQQVSLGIKL